MKWRLALIPLLLLTALGIATCTGHATTPTRPTIVKYDTVPLDIKGKTFTLEIADDNATREFGLMRRDYLAPDRGMIFIFGEPQDLNFWMKNCYIDLDIIWLDPKGKVLHIATLYAGDEVGDHSQEPAQYVVEINAGAARLAGLKVGDTLQLPRTVIARSFSPGAKE